MSLLFHECRNDVRCRNRPGIVLMMTVVLLVILSLLGYTLVTRLAAQRHRDQYIIDYQAARYACDSAVKYALVAMTDVNASQLISRPNEPDFSDLFALTDEQYEQMLKDWARQNASNRSAADQGAESNDVNAPGLTAIKEEADQNSFNDSNEANSLFAVMDMNELQPVAVRGPYGPAWPCVTAPLEFQIGSAAVKIEIEDENAKLPLAWSMLDEKDGRREAKSGLQTFCEWMGLERNQIEDLQTQLMDIAAIKTFKLDYQTQKAPAPVSVATTAPRSKGRGRRARRMQQPPAPIPATTHIADFARLLHSSLISLDTLAEPTIVGNDRQESPLKYMGVWASKTVNVNTAPRHVLEAAFAFGGDADKIADEIIKRRRIKPFKDIDELKKAMFRYSDSIKKTEKYITTVSDFFTIRVTAASGVARASAVIAVTTVDKKMQKIAVLSG